MKNPDMGPGDPEQEKNESIKESVGFDIGLVSQEIEKFNSYLAELHAENPLAALKEDFFEHDHEPPPPGMIELIGVTDEEDMAAREMLAKREKELTKLEEKFGPGLNATGLAFIEKRYIKYGPIQLTLSDSRQFLKYLENLDNKAITPSQVEGIGKLLSHFYDLLRYGGEFEAVDGGVVEKFDEDQNDLVVELFRIKDELESACKKIDPDGKNGIVKSANKLNTLLEPAKKGYLREYNIAENNFLLVKPGEAYSLSDIHEAVLNPEEMPDYDLNGKPDYTHQPDMESRRRDALHNYERIWRVTLNNIRAIKKNNKARSLFEEAVENMFSVLDYQENEIRRREFDPNEQKIKSKLLRTIAKNRETLQMLR